MHGYEVLPNHDDLDDDGDPATKAVLVRRLEGYFELGVREHVLRLYFIGKG